MVGSTLRRLSAAGAASQWRPKLGEVNLTDGEAVSLGWGSPEGGTASNHADAFSNMVTRVEILPRCLARPSSVMGQRR